MKLLVTGGAGFIGVNFVRYWLDRHPASHVVVLDALTYAGNRNSLADLEDKAQFEFVHGDIRNQALIEKLLHDQALDTVVHLAACNRQDADWGELQGDNLDATINMFEAAVAHRVRRVVLASSNRVMAGYEVEGVSIGTALPPRPMDFFGLTKVVGEQLGRSYSERHGLSVICLRFGLILQGERARSAASGVGPANVAQQLGPLPGARALDSFRGRWFRSAECDVGQRRYVLGPERDGAGARV